MIRDTHKVRFWYLLGVPLKFLTITPVTYMGVPPPGGQSQIATSALRICFENLVIHQHKYNQVVDLGSEKTWDEKNWQNPLTFLYLVSECTSCSLATFLSKKRVLNFPYPIWLNLLCFGGFFCLLFNFRPFKIDLLVTENHFWYRWFSTQVAISRHFYIGVPLPRLLRLQNC